MFSGRRALSRVACGFACACFGIGVGLAQTESFTPEQIAGGSELYAEHCAVCHGPRMADPAGGFFDLRTFPPAQRNRFFNSVTNGKNSMPPWRSVLTQEQIGLLFAYVVAGERN